MAFRLYKEGQGTKARNVLAFIVGGTGVLLAVRTYDTFQGDGVEQSTFFQIPFFNWAVTFASVAAMAVLALFVVMGIWLYNHPKLSDFLIDTEAELKNKVTWPTRKEVFSNSVVVVVTCVLLGIWIVCADVVFRYVKDFVYGTG